MKIYRYQSPSGPRLAFGVNGDTVDVNAATYHRLLDEGHAASVAARVADHLVPNDLGELIAVCGDAVGEHVNRLVGQLADVDRDSMVERGTLLDPERTTLLPPLSASATVYCVGRNYAEHVAEAGKEIPTTPALFMRLHSSIVGSGQAVLRPSASRDFDWEGELAVIIGKPFRAVTADEALKFVYGYTVFNDGSLRDYQMGAPLLTAGKNFYASGSCGPCVTTADEVPEPSDLPLRTFLNDELMQQATTADMIFDVGSILAYISEFTTLRPGDIVATGTPAGVGFKRTPPRFLQPGDTLRIEVGELGPLVNSVEDDPRPATTPADPIAAAQ